MATRAIKPKRDEGAGRTWPTLPERAPSIVRAATPTTARVIGLVSVLLVAMGALAMLAPRWGLTYIIGPGWGFSFGALGVGGLLFHAFNESDRQFRLLYACLGFVLFAMGVLLRVISAEGVTGGYFLPYGVPCLGLALGFLASVARHETDALMRARIHALIGVAGGIMVLAGFFFGSVSRSFLPGEGIVLVLLGLVYVAAFIGMEGTVQPVGFRAAIGLGVVGGLAFLVALVRSFFPGAGVNYFVPDGLLLMGLGLLYVFISMCICCDWPVIVLLRRELTAYFYSPVAYLVLLGVTLVGWLMHFQFITVLTHPMFQPEEPVARRFFWALLPVIFLIFAVPVITMRLLSEEQRTGTMEQLFTTPVSETSVVLSKFFAALIFFLVALIPWALYLVSFRVLGGEPFDYRSMLSFFLALMCCGAGFVGIGLFFSSVTSNQIIAAVLTFGFLLVLMGIGLVPVGPPASDILSYVSYLELWNETLDGSFAPRRALIFVSVAIFFVFLTIKVLEARKWK